MIDPAQAPGGLIAELAAGRVRWDLVSAFPREDSAGLAAGDAVIERVSAVLDSVLEGRDAEDGREPPREFFEAAHREGLLRLQLDPADGGLGLPDHAAFRVVVAAMERSTALGFSLAAHNGIGLPALLAVVPSGPLRELIVKRLAQGAVSGWADTEPSGAGNTFPATVATPGGDGGFRLTGEKVFIANGTVADELIVSAAVPRPQGDPDACLFLVDTRSEGFHVLSSQEVAGLKGLPLGALRLDGVDVPAERVIVGPGVHWRDAGNGLLEAVSSRGRTYLVSGAALAIARRCVEIQRGFARRRAIDSRPLTQFPVISELTARSLADLYALETVVRWGLLGDSALTARHRERAAAKNITTIACWRIVDRTVSLLGAEGVETAVSKQRRAVPGPPVEQLFRDARVLRITGGVDFAVDFWLGEALVARVSREASSHTDVDEAEAPRDVRLSGPNAEHLDHITAQSRRLARAVGKLAQVGPGEATFDRQPAFAAVGGIAGELLAMTLTLARAADAGSTVGSREQLLADIFCRDARQRLALKWPDAEDGRESPAHRDVSNWWFKAA